MINLNDVGALPKGQINNNVILEISKSYVKRFYGGHLKECIRQKDGLLWTPGRIKAAFNNGNGTKEDLKRYINDNKQFAYFVNV